MSKENEKDNNKENEIKEKEKKEKKDKKEGNEEKEKEKDEDEKEYSKKIGDYILFEQIGQGTFSKVTRAFHIITEQIVAVKILDKQKIEDEIDIERIIREIEILRSISHPNISQMYETYSTVHNFYLMMEYVEGGDLFDFISDNCFLPENKACFFFRQLISVMEYLSELGISHRDIKPENILLDKNHENIKVIDFGLSNYCMEHELLHSSCGSPCYASPEMLSGNPYSGISTDLWSAGIVLYSMLVGALPFDDQELHKLYEQIKLGKFYIPSTLSLEAIDLLKRILQVDPNKRIKMKELKEHKWFNIEENPMYKGVNIFYEHLPCDTKVVQYVIKKYFSNDQDISLYSYIKMIHMHACNKYTATYYLVKKYILKVEDKHAIRKTKQNKNIDNKDDKTNDKNNDKSNKNIDNNNTHKDIKEKEFKFNKEKESIIEEKIILPENKDIKEELYLKLKEMKDEYNNEKNYLEKDKNRVKEREKESKKIEVIDDINKEKNEIQEYNIIQNKKNNNTRNIKNDIYDSYQTNITNNTNQINKCFCLTLEEDPSKHLSNIGNMNIFLSKKKFELKPEYNNSNKITKKYNHKKLIKQTNNQANDNNDNIKINKENIQKFNNVLLTEQPRIKNNKNKNSNVNNNQNDKIIIVKNSNKMSKDSDKKSINKNIDDADSQLKIGLSLINIKNIDDKFKINNDSNTDRILTDRQKNPILSNRVYSPNENYTINTIYKNNINRKDKKLKTYMDKIISPKKGDLNFYVINNIINKDKQEKKKNTKNELFNLEIKSNINKKNIISTTNNENIIVNINNNNYINGNINRNRCQNISIDNHFFRTQEIISNNGNISKDKKVSSQIKVNLKSSKGELKYSNSPINNTCVNKDIIKESKNPQKKFEIEIFSSKIKNLNKFKQRKTPSPFSIIHIQENNNEGSNIIKFNNNYFSNLLGQGSNEKGKNIVNLSSSQNKSENRTNINNNSKNNINKNKKKLYKDKIKKMMISHKKGKSLYGNCLEPNNIFNYFKENKKKRKNNHQRNISSVLKNQLSDFRTDNKGINSITNTVINNDYSSSKNKNPNNHQISNKKEASINKNKLVDIHNNNNNNNNNILSYSKEKILSPKIIYQSKNNLQKKRLFLQNTQNNNLNSFVIDKLKKNKLMITTGNNNKNISKKNNYLVTLNQSNSTTNHFLTDNNNHKLNKFNSNDNNLFSNNNKIDNNYMSNLSLVLKNGINKNKKLNSNELIMLKFKEKSNNKKQKNNNTDIQNNTHSKNTNIYK